MLLTHALNFIMWLMWIGHIWPIPVSISHISINASWCIPVPLEPPLSLCSTSASKAKIIWKGCREAGTLLPVGSSSTSRCVENDGLGWTQIVLAMAHQDDNLYVFVWLSRGSVRVHDSCWHAWLTLRKADNHWHPVSLQWFGSSKQSCYWEH